MGAIPVVAVTIIGGSYSYRMIHQHVSQFVEERATAIGLYRLCPYPNKPQTTLKHAD
ncbi:hypothetical protein PSI22_11875 [Xenorhabdus sp. XENO-7]|uniref:Uncharacterized protein n=1 Tax=Xenorhabdus aichiensis TaxID=3025874 RepID=A0ABT5M3P4_9GAMM|nr:hypothetical protein [Xenorhabdus aichiensis]MDC9622312.1 hypothetical protein [Xenorhabdus aichiensis]